MGRALRHFLKKKAVTFVLAGRGGLDCTPTVETDLSARIPQCHRP